MDEDQTLKILDEEVPGMKLESIIKMLGHEKRKIDVLKVFFLFLFFSFFSSLFLVFISLFF